MSVYDISDINEYDPIARPALYFKYTYNKDNNNNNDTTSYSLAVVIVTLDKAYYESENVERNIDIYDNPVRLFCEDDYD